MRVRNCLILPGNINRKIRNWMRYRLLLLKHAVQYTHPAESGNSQGNTGLELIWVFLAETGDKRDGCCHYSLNGKDTEKIKLVRLLLSTTVDSSNTAGYITSY